MQCVRCTSGTRFPRMALPLADCVFASIPKPYSWSENMSTPEQIAILGGGCFWCTEALFKSLKGVSEVVSGYSGGKYSHPSYREVKYGKSGHAEVVKIHFDPEILSFEDLLRVFFTTHNPTTPNQQGADKGHQYRSVIFWRNESQKIAAETIMAEMQTYFDDPIVTELSRYRSFFEAEEVHQDYYQENPEMPYCQVVITPKLQKLRALHGEKLKQAIENE